MRTEQYRFQAAYNEWMNERLYRVCAAIPDAQRKADRGAFFGSIHATLNHVLHADRIWLGRFHDDPPLPGALDAILYEDFDELREARRRLDARVTAWVATLDDVTLSSPLTYTSVTDRARRITTLWLALTHFFNHQTHHRGQLTTLLAQLEVDYGVTDMIAMPGAVETPAHA